MNCAAMRAKRLGANGNRALPSSTASRPRPRKRGAARLRCWQEDQWPQTPSARRCSWVGACCRRPSGRCSGPRWCASGVGSASAHLHTPAIDLGRWWLCRPAAWLGSESTGSKPPVHCGRNPSHVTAREPRGDRRLDRQESHRLDERSVNEPWRVMTFMWQAICAALFPVKLSNIKQALERFLAYLARWSNRKRERRAAVCLRNLQADAA